MTHRFPFKASSHQYQNIKTDNFSTARRLEFFVRPNGLIRADIDLTVLIKPYQSRLNEIKPLESNLLEFERSGSKGFEYVNFLVKALSTRGKTTFMAITIKPTWG